MRSLASFSVYHPFYVWGKTHWEYLRVACSRARAGTSDSSFLLHVLPRQNWLPSFHCSNYNLWWVWITGRLRVKAWKNHGHWEMFRTVTMQLNFLIDYEWSGIREIVFLSNFDSKLTSSDVLWEEKFAIISQYAIVWLFFWLWNMAGYLASGFPYSCFFRLDGFQRVMVWWHDAMMVNLASYTQPWAFQQEGCQPDTSLGQQIQRYFWTAHHW